MVESGMIGPAALDWIGRAGKIALFCFFAFLLHRLRLPDLSTISSNHPPFFPIVTFATGDSHSNTPPNWNITKAPLHSTSLDIELATGSSLN